MFFAAYAFGSNAKVKRPLAPVENREMGNKRAVVVGVLAFLLGSMNSPKAADQDETLRLLCKRFREFGGESYHDSAWRQRDHAISFLGTLVCAK